MKVYFFSADSAFPQSEMPLQCIPSTLKQGKRILLLHGIYSSAQHIFKHFGPLFSKQGYMVIACNHIGHQRVGDKYDWANMAREYEQIIQSLNIKILVGHSLGAGLALYLARNRAIEQAFAISAFHNLASITNYGWLRHIMLGRAYDLIDHLPEMKKITVAENRFPFSMRRKVFLIHGLNDPIVPLAHLQENVRALHVPRKQVLLVKGGHNIANKPEVIAFIKENLQ